MLTALIILGICTAAGAAIIQWIKERATGRENHHTFTMIFMVAGSLLAGVTSIIQSKQADEAEKKLAESYLKIISLQNKNIDSTDRVIELYTKLNQAQDNIISLQRQNLNEITGGENKPYFFLGHIISYPGPRITITFNLANIGKTNLKDVNIKILNRYKDLGTLVSSDSLGGIVFQSKSIPNQMNYQFVPAIDEYEEFNLGTLTKGARKTISKYELINGIRLYTYEAKIEWSNGSYQEKLSFVFRDSTIRILNIDIFENGVEQSDHFKYFNVEIPREYKALYKCGDLKYKDINYRVYWDKKSKSVLIGKTPTDFTGINIFSKTKAYSQEEALKKAPIILNETFGK